VRSRLLKTTVLAAVAGAAWTQMPQVTLRWKFRWRLSLKCWFIGHEDWIRRTPDRLYLKCFECGRETQGWATGKSQAQRDRGARTDASAITQVNHSSPRLVRSRMRQSPRLGRADHGDGTIAA
jgi:hypothetical protein